jgi:hypothetical protein
MCDVLEMPQASLAVAAEYVTVVVHSPASVLALLIDGQVIDG